ncbi:elongin A, like [Entelurus aequoreus]|uniref:elongin A, like n=1 Tax=Entelurus aequoreus TaxID=161455 RepID=UPI002B1D9E66|nr:elongin A, like [Entelurus aequoreus]
MASSSEAAKKVLRYKLQLAGTPQSATVLKILQKLNNLDITVDVLAETGIGKIVNSFRKHKDAGELAKTLVKGWKQLLPKKSASLTEDGNAPHSLFVKEKLTNDQNCPNRVEDLNNNGKCVETSNEHVTEKSYTEIREKDQNEPSDEDNTNKLGILSLKNDILEEKRDPTSKQKKNGDCKSRSEEQLEEKSGGCHLERKSKNKSKEICDDATSSDKSRNWDEVKEDRSSGSSRKKKREKEHKELSKPAKKVKIQPPVDHESEVEEPSMSFESYLNYDDNVPKKKERSRGKKPSKKIKTLFKKQPKLTVVKSTEMPASPKKKCIMESPKDLLSIPLPIILPEVSTFEYLERKVEKVPDFVDESEEGAVFTGQRLNKKMQVYSGTKTVFLPAMMSLYQQCIRTLQNNINLLYETGGVPFEILEPVLEKCTPEQLLRIEECNPVYIGVTDNLWGKHCQRDFKDAKLQQYESWKEMYVRLSEERERKFQRLAKKIVMDHSKKPKGRQVKMAFIHTVAKPPRNVRIQQEIHGTAVQQPPQSNCSVKSRDSKPKSYNDPVKTNTCGSSSSTNTISGPGNTQDSRKKTRVAPMMAKSLKAFKKQLGRR